MGYYDDDNQREADESLNQKDYQELGSTVFLTVQRPGTGQWIPDKTYLNEEDEWKLELPTSESESSPTPDEAKAPPTNIVFKHFLTELDLIMNPPKANDSLDMWPLRLAFIGKDSNSILNKKITQIDLISSTNKKKV